MADKQKKILNLALYLFLMLTLVVYLLVINSVMVSADTSLHKAKKVSDAEIQSLICPSDEEFPMVVSDNGYVQSAGGKMYFDVDVTAPAEDPLGSMTISGDAACATETDNPDKVTKILLIGEKNNYEIDATQEWSDITYHEYGVQGLTNGYIVSFSTLNIKSDRYHIGIYVRENPQTWGYVDTKTVLEKDFSGLHEYRGKEIDPMQGAYDGKVLAMFDYANTKLEGGYYTITGYAVKEGLDSAAADVYVNLCFEDGTVRTFATNLIVANWFADYCGSDLYNFSHYTLRIPKRAVLGKTAQLDILVDNEGVSACRDPELLVSFTDDGVKVICAEPVTDAMEVETGRTVQANGIVYDRPDFCKFQGVAYLSGGATGTPEIFAEIRRSDGATAIYPTTVSRGDWAAENMGEGYAMSSYAVKIDKAELGQGDIEMRLLIRDQGAVYGAEEPLVYLWQDDQFVLRDA